MSCTETPIEWTDRTWNPTRGCRRVSPGCENCYAERQAARFRKPGLAYEGLVQIGKQGARWTGDRRFVPEALVEPLRWRKPRRIFVDSMSDLFYFDDAEIAAVFGIMAACKQHTFQILTKRIEHAVAWFERAPDIGKHACELLDQAGIERGCGSAFDPDSWPLPNVAIGVSIENEPYAVQRLEQLRKIPAALRFVSYEPALGEVHWLRAVGEPPEEVWDQVNMEEHAAAVSEPDQLVPECEAMDDAINYGARPIVNPEYRDYENARRRRARALWLRETIGWMIIGGESGRGARPFDVMWARRTIEECRAAEIPVFMKQLGSHCVNSANGQQPERNTFGGGKGGDMNQWPQDLRVREFPQLGAREP